MVSSDAIMYRQNIRRCKTSSTRWWAAVCCEWRILKSVFRASNWSQIKSATYHTKMIAEGVRLRFSKTCSLLVPSKSSSPARTITSRSCSAQKTSFVSTPQLSLWHQRWFRSFGKRAKWTRRPASLSTISSESASLACRKRSWSSLSTRWRVFQL